MGKCKKSVRIIKWILTKITCGKYQSSLFFKNEQDQFSWLATLFTLAGMILILLLSLSVVKSIVEQKQVTVQYGKLGENLDFTYYDILDKIKPQLLISQIKFYECVPDGNKTFDKQVQLIRDYEDKQPCGGYRAQIDKIYMLNLNMSCEKEVSVYVVPGSETIMQSKIFILADLDYDQYKFKEKAISVQNVPITLECYDDNYCFSNNSLGERSADEIALAYLDYYFDNINQMKVTYKEQFGLSVDHQIQLGMKPIIFNKTDDIIQINPTFVESIYFSTYVETVLESNFLCDNTSLCIYFQQTLGDTIKVTPRSLVTALSQIGGYFSIFALFVIILVQLHRCCFNRGLQKYLDKSIEEMNKKSIEERKIEDVFSFEKLYEMGIELETLKKDNNEFEKNISSLKQSAHESQALTLSNSHNKQSSTQNNSILLESQKGINQTTFRNSSITYQNDRQHDFLALRSDGMNRLTQALIIEVNNESEQ